MQNSIYEYLVLDERYHYKGLEAGINFASNSFAEAKRVANEIGYNSVVVKYDTKTDEYELVYDAAFHTDLALEP